MTDLSGADLAVLNSRLEGVCRKMANTLLRTGRSGVLSRARDFSCCIVTAAGDLLSAAACLPIHVLSGPDLMARSMLAFHPVLRRGDAFLHNSPYHGCSHAADMTILLPVIDDAGRHHFTIVAKAHQADIGNAVPTTYHATARDVYEEGALIFPAVKILDDYEPVEDIVRICRMRIRVPEQWHGDFLAMIGASRIGERDLLAMAEELGWDRLAAFTRRWFDLSERRMRTALGQLPAARSTATVVHDPMFGTASGGVPIKAEITTHPDRGGITVDLRDNPDALPNGLNLSEACSRTAALIGVFNGIDPDVPKNAGSLRCVEILLRENCVAGIPRHPTSCSVATTNIADRVAGAVQLALAQLTTDSGLAEVGPNLPATKSVIAGRDPRTGERFVNQLFAGHTGGAASAFGDAWLTHSHVGNGGLGFIDSVEQDELAFPLLIHERRLLRDTEGAGRYCGAPALRVEFGPVGTTMDLTYSADGVLNRPLGARGGLPGAGASQSARRQDGRLEVLPTHGTVTLQPGEAIVATACGGGGFGPPQEREPEAVRAQMRDGLLSPERARNLYGVVLAPDGSVDAEETACRRGTRESLPVATMALVS